MVQITKKDTPDTCICYTNWYSLNIEAAQPLKNKEKQMNTIELNRVYLHRNTVDIQNARISIKSLNGELNDWLDMGNVDDAMRVNKEIAHQLVMISMYEDNIKLILKGMN